jgi:hypothetical protein
MCSQAREQNESELTAWCIRSIPNSLVCSHPLGHHVLWRSGLRAYPPTRKKPLPCPPPPTRGWRCAPSLSLRPTATPDGQSSSSPTQTIPPSAHLDPRAAWTACPRAFARQSSPLPVRAVPFMGTSLSTEARLTSRLPTDVESTFRQRMPRRNSLRTFHTQQLTPQARRNGVSSSGLFTPASASP